MKDGRKKPFTPRKEKQIKFPEDQIKVTNWVHYLLVALLLVLISFSIADVLWPQLFWHPFDFTDYPFYSTIEALGAIAAILVAFMPLQVLFGRYRPSYVFLSVGFLAMGLWDLFHSAHLIGHGFVFSHSIALLSGGFLFALFVFPWKFDPAPTKKSLMWIVGFLTLIFSLLVGYSRELFPEMIKDGHFTPVANTMNLMAGILFLVAAVKLIVLYVRDKNLGVLILVFAAVSSAIVGFIFQYSEAWTDSYWLWHIIRLIAFMTLLGYKFARILIISKERDEALHDLNKRIKEITCLFKVNETIKNPEVNIPEVMKNITRFIPKGWHYPENTAVEIVLDEKIYRSEGYREGNYHLLENILVNDNKRGCIKVTVFDPDSQQSKNPFIKEEKELLKIIAGNISIYVHRVESERALRESEENFRNVYTHSPVSLWEEDWTEIIAMIDKLKKEGVTDFKKYFNENRQFVKEAIKKVVINDVNPATLEMFEAESKDDLVKSLEVIFATEDTLSGFTGELIALAEGKQVFETEMKLNTANGNLINTMLRMSFPSQEMQDGQVLVSIMDITELNKVQEQLKVSMENLQRSNKELERFAYVASHDLQEPLRMVSSYTQLLERRYKGQLDERADKYIYYAVDGANRMQNLINDLLDFSRISTRGEKFTQTDTNEAVNNALKNLEARIDETSAQIKTGKLPLIDADAGQIERLFLNLIGNALKFGKPGKKPVIEIGAKEQNNNWLFHIKDNGIGIDKKFKEKVFVIFQRLHGAAQYKGTGIGLAICKRIVQRHEGEIWFESEENKGTTFYFTLKKI